MSQNMSMAVVSLCGLLRKKNEDNFSLNGLVNEKMEHDYAVRLVKAVEGWNCIGVMDGMGGGQCGEIAAIITAHNVARAQQMAGKATTEQMDKVMREAFQSSNNDIIAIQKEQNAIIGTTCTVLCTDGEKFKYYHCGDSRLYLFRDNKLYLLTKDQTMAALKLDAGLEVVEKEKHQLTDYIGYDNLKANHVGKKPIEGHWTKLHSHDRILVCTDGVTSMCSDQEICTVLAEVKDDIIAVKELSQRAMTYGGKDNITCVVITIK